jgi:hypothetical protein
MSSFCPLLFLTLVLALDFRWIFFAITPPVNSITLTYSIIQPFFVLNDECFILSIENEPKYNRKEANLAQIEEKSLERMEALLSHSALGVHVLFDNRSIAAVFSNQIVEEKDFYDFDKMKKVQDVMTELIAKKTYWEKISYINSLDTDAFQMLLRAYFHIVENSVRANSMDLH